MTLPVSAIDGLDANIEPITMLNDRVLVAVPPAEGERRSRSGILIPATAQIAKRLTWAEVAAVGPNVRTVRAKDKVLFNSEDCFEVELRGEDYLILRERDIHAMASGRLDHTTGLYLSSAGEPTRTGDPIVASEEELARITYDDRGLVPAIVQEATTQAVLMVGYMDAEALRRTLESGRTWFYSRSRQEYWPKGETSGDRQWVRSVAYDCDGDALLVRVDQDGKGACHTGEYSCFYRTLGES